MKLLSFLLLAATLQISAKGLTQKVTLSLKEAPLKTVFVELNRQTGYNFLYSDEALTEARPVTITVKNLPLDQVLELCFRDQPLEFKIGDGSIVVKKRAGVTADLQSAVRSTAEAAIKSPPIDVTGRVTDSTGAPLQGASVIVKGTKQGTRTDANGYFTLKGVDENATIEISYQGFELYSVKASANIGVVGLKMKENDLDVIVVNTGYETKKPNEINGSVFLVTNEMLNQQTSPYILDRLKDIAPGMFFNTNRSYSGTQNSNTQTNITIRGLSTIEGPLDPLVVLDNFIYEGSLYNINPNDIESVTILKDAAATSIWGVRAANGVIVLTSKKALFSQKLRIDIIANTTIIENPDLFAYPQLASSEFIDVEEFLFNKRFKLSDTSSPVKTSLTPVYEILLKRKYGQISSADSAKQIDALKTIDSREEFSKYFYQRAIQQQYTVNLRGGSQAFAWLISGSYNRGRSNLKGSNDQKTNIRFENSFKATKNLQMNFRLSYTNSNSLVSNISSFNSIIVGLKQIPYLKFADENGAALSVNHRYRGIFTDTVGHNRLLSWKFYPLEDYNHDKTAANVRELIASAGINYDPFKNLKFRFDYQFQRQWTVSERHADIESYFVRDLINLYTKLSPISPSLDTFRIPRGGILDVNNASQSSYNIRTQVNYSKNWASHAISSILGGELREVRREGNNFRIYGYNEDPLQIRQVDFLTRYPTFITGTPSSIPSPPQINNTIINRFISLYGNLAYTYKQRYSLSASARKDGSNLFGFTANNKWNPLWSAGVGWVVSKEKFYKLSWIPYLRFKASVGYSGNMDLSKTALPIATASVYAVTNFPTLRVTTLNNPYLRWERTKQVNIGFDFSTKAETFSGSIEYYRKISMDLFASAPYNYTTWGANAQIKQNVANLNGQGVDISILTKNIKGAFAWSTRLVHSYNTSKVTQFYTIASQNVANILNNNGTTITPIIGKPLFAIAAYKWGGLNSSGDPQGYLNGALSTDYDAIFAEAETKQTSGNMIYFGSAEPTHFGSIINMIEYKGLSLSFNISYRLGYYFKKQSILYSDLYNSGIGNSDFSKRWKKPGDELFTVVPGMVYTDYLNFSDRDAFYEHSEVNILKGDHVRLQYINIGYAFEREIKPFRQLRLYFNAGNLGILWRANTEKIDPDFPQRPSPSSQFTFGVSTSL